MVLAESTWWGVNAIGTMTLAATKEPAGLASAFQQIGERASCGGLDEQHATEGWTGLAR